MKLIIYDIPSPQSCIVAPLFYFFFANMQIKNNKLEIQPEKHVSLFYVKIVPGSL